MSSPPNHVPIGRYKNTRCGFSTTGSLFQPFSHHLPNLFSSSCPQQPAVTANPSVTIFPTSSPHPVLNLLLSSLHFLLWPRLASTFLNLNSPLLKAIASWMGWCDTPYSPLLKAIASWMGWCDTPTRQSEGQGRVQRVCVCVCVTRLHASLRGKEGYSVCVYVYVCVCLHVCTFVRVRMRMCGKKCGGALTSFPSLILIMAALHLFSPPIFPCSWTSISEHCFCCVMLLVLVLSLTLFATIMVLTAAKKHCTIMALTAAKKHNNGILRWTTFDGHNCIKRRPYRDPSLLRFLRESP
jgi:hypothetical protein